MTDKRDEALKLALENICAAKLCEFNSMSSRHEMIRLMDAAIPATHRIVPVELLERCSREFQSMEGTELAYPEHAAAVQCYHELRAIIDKVPTLHPEDKKKWSAGK